MFLKFLLVRYLIRISNYLERIIPYDMAHIMSMADLVAIGVETIKIYSGCSSEKEFIELCKSLNGIIPKCKSC